jgi:serine phosphatase RsbU (regulator of sigma subunit)
MENGTMKYAGAGHPPVLQVRKSDGSARELLRNGFFLGMFPEADYSAVQVQVEPGDRVVLYTDGILEAKNAAGEEFTTGRLLHFLKNNLRLTASQCAGTLVNEVSCWSGQAPGKGQQDDITLLVVDFLHC